ncbi:MAG: folylpolyglutamate synthase/dihydrofolate synthase family protein [Candidatus Limnocylindria bacterium]
MARRRGAVVPQRGAGARQRGAVATGRPATSPDDEAARERAALDWLMRFSDPERGIGWNPRSSRAPRWRLGRMGRLLETLGRPDRGMDCVVIAGTKGKGSTAAFLASALHAAGVRAGLFNSPHLQDYRERVRIDGEMIAPGAFADAVRRLRPAVSALRRSAPAGGEPTTYELTLALALRAFADARCAIAVIEVGLGGTQDAANALEPVVSVITSIGYDHTAILGRTLAAIAMQKAGIMRRGRPAIIAVQRPAAAAALRRACVTAGALCTIVPPHREGVLGLTGAHQEQNAALARAAATELGRLGHHLTGKAVARGLAAARWPGRFELVRGRPLIVLDGAHNGSSAEALADTLRREYPGRAVRLVIGINVDKDASAVLRPLLPVCASVTVTASTSARARSVADLARACGRLARVPLEAAPNVEAAIRLARARTGPRDVLCVTGSLAVVGDARSALGLPALVRLWN